jgi:pyrophosphate--fructose-6-phosphate 1-phosphotransferase
MSEKFSILEKKRLDYEPTLPQILEDPLSIGIKKKDISLSGKDEEKIKTLFPKTFSQPLVELEKQNSTSFNPINVGVVFSGGQAAGGHNVISGLFDALNKINPKNKLYGFLGGPSGIVDNKTIEITEKLLLSYRNQGGFDLIGSGRTKIESQEQLKSSMKTVKDLNLDGIVVIGGDDSNTNAAILAEFFVQNDSKTKVIGVPKTIDGDLKNEYIEVSFGFDTACKIYSEMIGNLQKDTLSAKKYYHFVKLMGRSASHIALECALKNHPNYVIIGEEVKEKKMTLRQITTLLADIIVMRSEEEKNYGVFLIPEGLIEFIPEMQLLIKELNSILSTQENSSINEKKESLKKHLSKESKECYESLPEKIQHQLLLDRDPHGNVQVSLIETEKLLSEVVKKELEKRKEEKKYKGKFNALHHFYGYEGRCGLPSNFDSKYCYALGNVAAILLANGLTGYMSCVYDLHSPSEKWKARGLPITMLMNMEERKGKEKPVIKKALVELDSESFKKLLGFRETWKKEDNYINPGPIQFFGDAQITDSLPLTI